MFVDFSLFHVEALVSWPDFSQILSILVSLSQF